MLWEVSRSSVRLFLLYSPECVEGEFLELRRYGVLRRVMCNELNQQVRQMAQRSSEGVVDLLCAGVGCDLGR